MMKNKIKKSNSGFALLVSIVTTGILLLISFVVADVAFKQLIISSAYQSSQQAFYMADSGMECAQYWDVKNPNNTTISAFATSTPGSILCNGQAVNTGKESVANGNPVATNPPQSSVIGGTSPSIFQINFGNSCAIVLVTKNADGTTKIDSHGYNTCDSSAGRRYERGITTTY